MGGTFSLLVGLGLLGVSMNLGQVNKPYDWLTTPAQKYMEEVPGNKGLSVNYSPTVAAFETAENYKRFAGSQTLRSRALQYQGSSSRDPRTRAAATEDMVNQNRRWGSAAFGDAVRFTYQDSNQ